MTSHIAIARVYDVIVDNERDRLLIDGISPRGVAKADLAHDEWIKEVAPSGPLQTWFAHDPAKWGEFRNRYLHELANKPDAVERCLGWCRQGPVTLLFSAKDREHNQAVVLGGYLLQTH